MPSTVDVLLPQFGMGNQEGVILTWLVAVHERVAEHQPIAQIEVEKIDVELESPASGRIVEILIEEGETVIVQQVLARIVID